MGLGGAKAATAWQRWIVHLVTLVDEVFLKVYERFTEKGSRLLVSAPANTLMVEKVGKFSGGQGLVADARTRGKPGSTTTLCFIWKKLFITLVCLE